MYPLHPKLSAIQQSVCASKRLEKIAGHYADDPKMLSKLAQAKVRLDAEVFALIKRAGLLSSVGKGAAIGGGVATAAAIPVYLTGSALFDKGRDTAKETAADVRNKVLQGALGVAATGAGLYGLSNLIGSRGSNFAHSLLGGALGGSGAAQAAPPATPVAQAEPPIQPPNKYASDRVAQKAEVLEKLATVGVIEEMLNGLPGNLDEETSKHAAEVQALNRSYGVHLLNELYTND